MADVVLDVFVISVYGGGKGHPSHRLQVSLFARHTRIVVAPCAKTRCHWLFVGNRMACPNRFNTFQKQPVSAIIPFSWPTRSRLAFQEVSTLEGWIGPTPNMERWRAIHGCWTQRPMGAPPSPSEPQATGLAVESVVTGAMSCFLLNWRRRLVVSLQQATRSGTPVGSSRTQMNCPGFTRPPPLRF